MWNLPLVGRLIETLPLFIIGAMVAGKRKLSKKEAFVQSKFTENLFNENHQPQTAKPVIVAIIGLVGSGKTTVARALAQLLDAAVVSNDGIRVVLRKEGVGYDQTWAIAENLAINLAQTQRNVVIDSDFVDPRKRASLRERTNKAGVRLVFVRVVCDFDVMIQRVVTGEPDEFFNGASSLLEAPDKGRYIKLRELLRRLSLHYRWESYDGGQWVIKKFPTVTATIDTSLGLWKRETTKCAETLLKPLELKR